MRKILTIALALTMCTSAAMADSNVGVYRDQAGTDCSLAMAPGLVTVYLIQNLSTGSSGTSFMVNDHLGIGAPIATTVTTDYLAIGSYFTGIDMTYPCVVGAHVLGTLLYFYQGVPAVNCLNTVEVVAHPLSDIPGKIVSLDCTLPFGVITPATGGIAYAAPVSAHCGSCSSPLAVNESTWGGIKALYR